MAPGQRRRPRKNNMVGITRMDAALDAMRPFGFDERLVREIIDELLDVYEGNQGWPFIEEASYKLLIETILGKQQISSEEKTNVSISHPSKKKKEDFVQDTARREGETETSATPTTGISEAGSSNLMAQDSLLLTMDGLDSAPQTQTNDARDSASLGNLEFDGSHLILPTKREGRSGQSTRVEPENERKPVDDAIGSNKKDMGAKHLESTFSFIKPPVIQSSQRSENVSFRRRKPCYGWISSDEEEDLIHLPLPPIPEELQKLLDYSAAPQTGTKRRRKSRWDEKPNDVK